MTENLHPFAKFKPTDFPKPFIGQMLRRSDSESELPEALRDVSRFVFKATPTGIRIEHYWPMPRAWDAYNHQRFWPSELIWFAENQRLHELIENEIPNSPVEDKEVLKRWIEESPIHSLWNLRMEEMAATDAELPAIRKKHNLPKTVSFRFGPMRCVHEEIRLPDYAGVSIDFDADEEMWLLQVWYSEDFDKDVPFDVYNVDSFQDLLEVKDHVKLEGTNDEIKKRFLEADDRWEKFF